MKMFLFVVSIAGLWASGGGVASATSLTSPAGTIYTGTLKGELTSGGFWNLGSSFQGNVNCNKSTFEGSVSSHGAGVTVKGTFSKFELSSCSCPVTVLKSGSFEIHATGGGNGTMTTSGTQITVQCLGLHCIYTTSSTLLGTITGGTPAQWETEFESVPRTGGGSGSFCGSAAQINATYKFTSPGTLLVS